MTGGGPLDRPIWSSLTGPHAQFAKSEGAARRYRPEIHAFIDLADDEPATLAAAAGLITPGEKVYCLRADAVPDLPGIATNLRRNGVQMVLEHAPEPPESDPQLVQLGESDVGEILALVALTEPGPIRPETWRMGNFIGIFHQGCLIAMAGERMKLDGYCEVSGICTHPEFRGQGLARRLTLAVMQRILGRGEIPFLHAWQDNHGAIALYEKLGFRLRTVMNVVVFERAAG